MPKVTSRDGTVIAYDKKGEGPVLIVVLGALNKRGSGKKYAEALKETFMVVNYDRRGRGDSTEVLPYSTDKEVEDIEALIDELGGKAYLYGHSSGSVLVLKAAQKLGDKVAGIAVYELPYNGESEGLKQHDEYAKTLRAALAAEERGEAVSLFVKSVGVTDNQINAMKKLPMWKGLTAMAPTLAYDTIALMEEYSTLDVSDVQASALVMYGGDSPAFMGETATRLSEALPHATLEKLEGQWHDVKAEAIAPLLIAKFAH